MNNSVWRWIAAAALLGATGCPDDDTANGGMADVAGDAASGDAAGGDAGGGDVGGGDIGGDVGGGDIGGDVGGGDIGGDVGGGDIGGDAGGGDAGGDAGGGDAGGDTGDAGEEPLDPATAPRALIDRFSAEAGTLMVRDDTNGLPGPGAPIDMDQPPFVTMGKGPAGELVRYYNFDVQPTTPAPIYVLFVEGAEDPVPGQLNIVDVIPGDDDYNDFWQPMRVDVPDGYVANTITSAEEVMAGGFTVTPMNVLVNCPIVPEGSTATLSLGSEDPQPLHMGWYQDQVVTYFSFEEAPLAPIGGLVPTSPIYVTFNVNPPDGGPADGFVTEPGTQQTHNVVATLPGQAGYSPLWSVNVYDNADFDAVDDLASAAAANVLAMGVANVNCPIVAVAPEEPLDPATAPRALIDRFSPEAGTLMVRDDANGLPGPGAPIDMDQGPFVTMGLGPAGQHVRYYNFDVQPTTPAPIYVLFPLGGDAPVEGQLNIVGVIPGDTGYSDFWQPVRVDVPANYVANTITSAAEATAKGLSMTPMDVIVNCPLVPEGSTADLSFGSEDPQPLHMGWYEDQVVTYFSFEEAPLAPVEGAVPTSPIFVTFNVNPPDGGPADGFVTEPGTMQTHNVVATLPGDAGYSPLWSVSVYDNAGFDTVMDLASAAGSNVLASGVANVNCPIVDVAE